MNWQPKDRPFKVFQRVKLFNSLSFMPRYLTLPGNTCEDVICGVDLKVFDPQRTFITAVENNYNYFREMEKWFIDNWKKNNYRLIYDNLCNVKDIGCTNLAFLDYLGNPTEADCLWIKNWLAPTLSPGACVGMTVNHSYRHNLFYPKLKSFLHSNHYAYYKAAQIEIRDKGIKCLKYLKMLAAYKVLFHCYLLPTYGYTISFHHYSESSSPNVMFLIRLENIYKYEQSNLSREECLIRASIHSMLKACQKGVDMGVVNGKIISEVNLQSCDVIQSLLNQENHANQLLDLFVETRSIERPDLSPKMIRAGILSHVRRKQNLALA